MSIDLVIRSASQSVRGWIIRCGTRKGIFSPRVLDPQIGNISVPLEPVKSDGTAVSVKDQRLTASCSQFPTVHMMGP